MNPQSRRQPPIDPAVPERLALVRAAKATKHVRTGRSDLTPAELDRILPPVDCLRTRLRSRGMSYREYARRLP